MDAGILPDYSQRRAETTANDAVNSPHHLHSREWRISQTTSALPTPPERRQ
jgi:hypothetical protein